MKFFKIIFTLYFVTILSSCNHAQNEQANTQKLILVQDEKGNYSLKDQAGNVVVTENKALGEVSINEFHEGLAVLKMNGKVGFIDSAGKVLIPFKYDWCHEFINGKAKVEIDNKKYAIDKKAIN